MERILIFIKHHVPFLWEIIEKTNGFFFSLLFAKRMKKISDRVIEEYPDNLFTYRKLIPSDLEPLHHMLSSQTPKNLKYFNPHDFDIPSLIKQMSNPAFLMMGVFDESKLIGYFFLRFFITRKCFVGRLIDAAYLGKGIGRGMNCIMYETVWQINFRCLSTISKNNPSVIKAHSKNPNMIVLRELDDDYLMVEFVREKEAKS